MNQTLKNTVVPFIGLLLVYVPVFVLAPILGTSYIVLATIGGASLVLLVAVAIAGYVYRLISKYRARQGSDKAVSRVVPIIIK